MWKSCWVKPNKATPKSFCWPQLGCSHVFCRFVCPWKNCLSVRELLIAGGERGVLVCGRHFIFCLIASLTQRESKMSLTLARWKGKLFFKVFSVILKCWLRCFFSGCMVCLLPKSGFYTFKKQRSGDLTSCTPGKCLFLHRSPKLPPWLEASSFLCWRHLLVRNEFFQASLLPSSYQGCHKARASAPNLFPVMPSFTCLFCWKTCCFLLLMTQGV